MGAHSDRRSISTSTVITVLCLCGTVVALQQTLVVPLLPDFPRILNTSPDNTSWLVTATLLTSAVATPIVSRMADMFGKRRMMIVCMIAMVTGSVIAAAGSTFLTLVTGRTLQGFAAALIPVGISIMRDELPREKVASAVALMSATLGIGSAAGLPLSGLIYEHFGWHWIFWLSAAVGVALIVAVLSIVPESSVRTPGRFDFGGAILLSVALTSLLLAISKGAEWGWSSERVIALFVIAVVVLVGWVPYELRVGQPMVDIRTSSRKPVLLTNIASVLVGFSMYANMLSTTQQLQMPTITGYGFGLSVVVAGLCMVPGGLAMVFFAPVSAVITRRRGAKTTLVVGAVSLAVGYVARVFLTDEVWQVVVGATLVSVGTAIAYAAMPTLIMRAVPITETASANGLNTLLRAVGTSTSSAVVGVVLTTTVLTVGGTSLPSLDAFKHIFWFAAIAALLAAGVALRLPRTVRTITADTGSADSPVDAPPLQDTEEIKGAGRESEIVVRGLVLRDDDLKPIRQAVVNVLSTSGEAVDWSRADNDGSYSVVLPCAGRYVVVSSADGWAPMSTIMEFTDTETQQHIRLEHRLHLSGAITRSGMPLVGAVLTVTKPSGETIGSGTTDESGHYALPLPPTGRYILTVVDADATSTQSRQIVIAAQSTTFNLELERSSSTATSAPTKVPT